MSWFRRRRPRIATIANALDVPLASDAVGGDNEVLDDDLQFQSLSSQLSAVADYISDFPELAFDRLVAAWRWVYDRHFVIACIGFVLMDVMTSVYNKRLMDHSSNYALFTMQLLLTFFFVAFGLICIACKFIIPEYMKKPTGVKPLLLLSLLDMVSNVLSTIGSTRTSGIMMVLLGQIGIPLTMVTCKLIMDRKYHGFHYIGALLIVAFVFFKELNTETSPQTNSLNFNLIYMAASIPDSISAALKGMQYRSEVFNLPKYQFFVAAMQFGYSIPGMFIYAVSKGHDSWYENLSHFIVNGSKCIFKGVNTVTTQCGVGDQPACDNCQYALLILAMYLCFNIIIRICYCIIMYKGSVALLFLLGTVKVPLCSIAFSLKFISGSSATTFRIIDVFSLIGILLGLLIYAYGSRQLELQATAENEQQLSAVPLIAHGTVLGEDS